jgi:large subunit ribosomal protein L5
MATATQTAQRPRLKERYDEELRARLKDELDLSSVMRVPRLAKITLNMGVGDAKVETKALDSAIEELTTIAGQRAQVRKARKSIAGFKLREGMPIGARVTLRGDRMWEFLDRLGNYSIGIREQIIFPEINYDDIQAVRGLDVAITTTAQNDDEGYALLRGLGLPFREREGSEETSG